MTQVLIQETQYMMYNHVPMEVSPYVSTDQWNIICDDIKNAKTDGSVFACACEVCLCMLFVFPCIFCCHPFFEGVCANDQLQRKCVKLNHLIFFGVGVMSATESNGILFNFALCVPKYAGPVVIEPGVPIASPDADSKNPILAQAIPISNSNNT